MLIAASVLLVLGVLIGSTQLSLIALLLGMLCKKYGYDVLFKEYDAKKDEKMKKLKRRRLKNE